MTSLPQGSEGLVRAARDTLPPLALITAGVYLLSALIGFSMGEHRGPILVQVSTALAQIAFYAWARRRRSLASLHANLGASGLVVLALINITVGNHHSPEELTLTSFVLVQLGIAFLFLSWAWFLPMMGLSYVVMGYAAWAGELPSLRDFLMTAVASGAAASAFHLARLRTSQHYERQRAELADAVREATESRQRYQSLVEGIPVGVYRTDPHGRFLDVNTAAARILELPDRAALLGTNAELLYADPSGRERWREAIERDGAVQGWEAELLRRDGTTAWIRDSAHAIRSEEGRTLYYEGIVEDITEQKRSEAKLEEARRTMAQRERLSSLGTLVAGVAHEINNPLTYIRGNVEILQMDADDLLEQDALSPDLRARLTESKRLQSVILAGVDRVAEITKSLKHVARAPNPTRSVENVNAVVESVVTVAAARLKDSTPIRVDLQANRKVRTNANELAQVLLNLLFNAADALEGRMDGRVVVRTIDTGGWVTVEVEDNGPGIPEAEQHKIFVPFHTTKSAGTGLGLSVSHSIVESHGGRLSFSSRPGVTRFRVELPAVE